MPFATSRRSSARSTWTFLAMLVGTSTCFADGNVFTQKPEVAEARTRGESASPTPPVAIPGRTELGKGPAPTWIWGSNPDSAYVLRKEFPGGSKAARLLATADNRMTVYVNGKKVASSDSWQEPVEVDVQDKLVPGRNELAVEVANEGGISAFALKLALISPEGEARYVVSDPSWLAIRRDTKAMAPLRSFGTMGVAPWGDVFTESLTQPSSSARGVFEVPSGFQVERLFTVPREELGSWVAIAFDDKGRLIASDQDDKGLCRITLPPLGSDAPTRVERLGLAITSAQGILHAFGHLYLSVNGGPGSGLYRATDTDGDDQYDKLEKLATFEGGGEHGPHALRLSPDGKSIYVVAGNHTLPPSKIDASRVPQNWAEDHLLPRQWDANGHARGILAPGGWVAKTDPDGKTWEVVSIGYRNSYDMAFNADGELFVYDADMEWDYGMPWYRPTRVSHSPSGSEFGWRSGTGKWPAYYADSLPAIVDVGPGSPVGVTFGYGLKFPAKYQKALYICDWTFGTMYAIHAKPSGSSYTATKEEFLSRPPLPLTDNAVGPDGALYFTIGGRGTQSELFRVTYHGAKSTEPVELHDAEFADLRALRHRLESYHQKSDDPAGAVAFAYPFLGHEDRTIRYAARVALEHQDAKLWAEKVLAEHDPETLITGAIALARQGDKSLEPRLIEALERLDPGSLPESRLLEWLRALQLTFIRMGEPDPATGARLASKLDAVFPGPSDPANRELASLLVYLKAPGIAGKLLALMEKGDASSSEEMSDLLARNPGYGGTIAKMMTNRPEATNIHYAFVLRNLREGWTPDQRKAYFQWLDKARGWSGGASYLGFINNIDKDAFENASEAERLAVEAAGARKPYQVKELPKPNGPGHEWTLAELLPMVDESRSGRDFAAGQKAFAAARCVLCHRFAGEGGATGPDLTQAAGRFAFKDLAEATLEPSKVVSDQYRASTIATSAGKVFSGRVVGESKDKLTVLIDPEDSTKVVDIPRGEIEEMKPSEVSLMPEKLLDPLGRDEILDLFAYILSRGDANDPVFKKK
ncbi:c-type cytochrome [Tundrisphaera lichenicola]|uniref:c-type cytochrome n=1 Tax=Tundrisphaera lichenicola TaxID=2029860 RepID=UPI003EB8802E